MSSGTLTYTGQPQEGPTTTTGSTQSSEYPSPTCSSNTSEYVILLSSMRHQTFAVQSLRRRHTNIAIVGGVVGGIVGLIVVTLLSLCIRRHQFLLRQPLSTNSDSLDSKRKGPVIEPFLEFRHSNGAPHQVHAPRRLPQKGRLGTAAPSWRWPASTTAYSTEPGPSIEPPSTVSSGGMTHREALAQQVRELREEIRRLRDLALRASKTGPPLGPSSQMQ